MTTIPTQVHFLFHKSSYCYKFDVLPSKPQILYTHTHTYTHTIFQIVFVIKPLHIYIIVSCIMGFPGSSNGKESACKARSLIPGSGRSLGEGHGNSFPYSHLENPMDRGAWRATVHGVAKSQTRLHLHFSLYLMVQDHQEPIFISPPDVFWGICSS